VESRAAAEKDDSSGTSVEGGDGNKSKGCGVGAGALSWQPSVFKAWQMYQPNKHVTTSAAHALGLFFEDIGASLARAAAQHARNDVSSEGGYRFAGSTEGFLLRVKHVDEALRIVLGKKNTPELFKLAVAQGIKAVRKLRSASRLQPTRPTLSSSTYRQSALSLPSSVNVNIEALSSAGSSANLHFDLVPAEKLLNKAILNLMPDSQADNGPVVTCTIGAAVYLTAVLEYVNTFQFPFTKTAQSYCTQLLRLCCL
jgi:hypothetical protein